MWLITTKNMAFRLALVLVLSVVLPCQIIVTGATTEQYNSLEYAGGVYPYNDHFNHAFGPKTDHIDPFTAAMLVVRYISIRYFES